jgi:hypothetical protein
MNLKHCKNGWIAEMSRSKKKHPGGPMCSGGCQAMFRKQENRAKRRKVKTILIKQDYDKLPHEKEYGNEWDSPRDGKQYWIDHDARWMRK